MNPFPTLHTCLRTKCCWNKFIGNKRGNKREAEFVRIRYNRSNNGTKHADSSSGRRTLLKRVTTRKEQQNCAMALGNSYWQLRGEIASNLPPGHIMEDNMYLPNSCPYLLDIERNPSAGYRLAAARGLINDEGCHGRETPKLYAQFLVRKSLDHVSAKISGLKL